MERIFPSFAGTNGVSTRSIVRSNAIIVTTAAAKQLNEWSGPILDVPSNQTVHALIKAKALEAPHQKAAVFCGTSWTYDELNHRANVVASRLITNGTKPGDRVGILTRPSLDMTAAVLGVLKAGAAFVPIDADYPAQRIAYMLEDCGAEVLLMQKDLLHHLHLQVMCCS